MSHASVPSARGDSNRAVPKGPAEGASATLACWVGAGGEAVAARLATAMAQDLEVGWGWRLIATGGERRSALAPWTARAEAPELPSLRELAHAGAQIVLVLALEPPGVADLRLLCENARAVLLSAPAPTSASEAVDLGDGLARARMVPSMRLSEAARLAEPLLEELVAEAPLSRIAVRSRAGVGGSLSSALADACDVLDAWCGPCESVFAQVSRGAAGATDGIAFIAVTPDGRVATADVAVGSLPWERSIDFIGRTGRVLVADGLVQRWDAEGKESERHEVPAPRDAVDAAIESLAALARGRLASAEGEDGTRALRRLALADAVRLSARTSNPERPDRFLALSGRP